MKQRPTVTALVKTRTFVLVDDEQPWLDLLCMFFRKQNHRARPFLESTKVMGWLEKNPCDAAILDLAMPGLGGLSLTRMIRQRFPDLPVIIMTGHGQDESRVKESLDAGANAYISKGMPIDELNAALQRVLVPMRHNGLQRRGAAPSFTRSFATL